MLQYLAALDDAAKLLIGAASHSPADIQAILSSTDTLSCRLHDKYLVVTKDAIRVSDTSGNGLLCDRTGRSFSTTGYNAF